MEYELIFEVSIFDDDLIMAACIGFSFMAMSYALLRKPKLMVLLTWGRSDKWDRLFVKFFFVFSTLWTVVGLTGKLSHQISARNTYLAGEFQVVEGLVANFDAKPLGVRKDESFTINGVRFAYSDGDGSAGFNTTRAKGGPIYNGLQVKIAYKGNTILKLEVAESQLR